jgi:hypothetical protein
MRIVKALISLATIGLCGAAAAEQAVELAPPQAASSEPAAPQEQLAGWQPLAEGYYGIPQGYVYTPTYTFGGAGITVEQLRGELAVQRGETCGASLYSVDVKHDPNQTVLTRYFFDAYGVATLPVSHQKIYAAVVIVHQPYAYGGRCIVRLAGKVVGGGGGGGDGGEEPGNFELAGALNYQGGFRQRLTLEIAGGPRISRFWLRIPEHCGGIEVLDAGSVTEGIYDAADQVDAQSHIFEVASGSERVGAVAASLNGPSTASCEIPVFIERAGA